MEFILFVHIPKTAGTSFRKGLVESLGDEAVVSDYGPNSPETSLQIQRHLYNGKPSMSALWETLNSGPYHALCGHFSARKFPFSKHCRVISFVREPLERAISAYYHGTRHHHLTVGIEEYLLNEKRADIQRKLLKGIGKESILGVSERYLDTVKMIYFKTNIWIPYLRENRNPDRKNPFTAGRLISNTCRQRFYQLNAEDYALYHKAVRTLNESLSIPVSASKRWRFWFLTVGFYVARPFSVVVKTNLLNYIRNQYMKCTR